MLRSRLARSSRAKPTGPKICRTLAPLIALVALSSPGQAQDDVTRLVPNDFYQFNQQFGCSVAFVGDYAVAGARGDSTLGAESGAVYVFDRNTGAQASKLLPPDGMNAGFFGSCVVPWKDKLLVGCPYDDTKGPFTGAVYLLEIPSGTMLTKYFGSQVKYGSFGQAIAVDHERAFFGAPSDSATKYATGAVFVYDLVTHQKVKKVVASDGNKNDQFGRSVAVGQGKLVVGAPEKEPGKRGRVYVFDRDTLEELYSLEPGSDEDWYFGRSVAVGGGRILVGAPRTWYEGSGGTVFVYAAQTGVLLGELRPEPQSDSDTFGTDIRLEGDLALIGAPFQDGATHRSGVAFLFHVPSARQLSRTAVPSTDTALASFAMWLERGRALMGAPSDGTFVQGCGGAWEVDLRQALGTGYCAPANSNSTGLPAEIRGLGFAYASTNLLDLVATQLPPHQPGFFLTSLTPGFVPFVSGSQGNLCLGGEIARFAEPVADSGPEGRLAASIDLEHIPTSPPSAVQAGETWHFQAWYRDLNPGSTSNLSDGLAITFL